MVKDQKARTFDVRLATFDTLPHRAGFLFVAALVLALGSGSKAKGGTVRLWPSAVVIGEQVCLIDLCELNGLEPEVERRLVDLVVASAPPPGGTRVIHLEMIRSALASSGANMAELTLQGAVHCTLSRPGDPTREMRENASSKDFRDNPAQHPPGEEQALNVATRDGDSFTTDAPAPPVSQTLRQAVADHFNRELARYDATADVTFDRASEAVLDLSNPPYEFHVRRRRGSPLGLMPLDVEVLAKDRIVQTVPLIVRVSMLRPAVVARRAIGQDATIRAADVSVTPMTFSNLDRIGIDDTAMAIGQRAKRFIPAGTLVEQDMLDSVPLVKRGELVTLASVVGGVRVVTTAKATDDGLLGDVVKMRGLNRKGVEFDAVVTGPGEAQIGRVVAARRPVAVAMGETK